ncbi:MAG: aspartyl protease family protein [Nitrososphaerota archaeon]
MYGPKGMVEVRALVDAGATFTKISRSDAEKIGLSVMRETLEQLSTGQ